MIIITDLVAGYDNNCVINNLNLSLETGYIHGLIGLNGSGKTTLFRCISGILKHKSGSLFMDRDVLTRRSVSFLETEPFFYKGITGREFLDLFKSGSKLGFAINEWAQLLHIPIDTLIDFYSTGQKKKLALLGVIKSGKKLMLLDEPFNGLDLESSRILSAVLPRLSEGGSTIIITSHILDTLKGICSKIHYLSGGKIQKSFTDVEADLIEKFVFHDMDKDLQNKIDGLV